MWSARYWATRFWGPRYWDKSGAVLQNRIALYGTWSIMPWIEMAELSCAPWVGAQQWAIEPPE